TADQYAQTYPEVWVLPATESEFHQSFKRDLVRHLAILADQDANTRSWAARGYGLVMRKIR
ncbi:MAG: hypothetical protein U1D69_10325, partial [Polynucleobacter sp.]|nr:hypothetical protein [Polynucleobacter sp.]